jgi:hypothetical protein
LFYRLARLLWLAGRYKNFVPTRFIAPIDCSKIPALCFFWVLPRGRRGRGGTEREGNTILELNRNHRCLKCMCLGVGIPSSFSWRVDTFAFLISATTTTTTTTTTTIPYEGDSAQFFGGNAKVFLYFSRRYTLQIIFFHLSIYCQY